MTENPDPAPRVLLEPIAAVLTEPGADG